MQNIYDIIYSYSKKNLLLDKKAINKIIDIILDINNINNIEYVNIDTQFHLFGDRNVLANYVNNGINIYYNRIISTIRRDKYKANLVQEDRLSFYESTLYKNLFILGTIIHEIEHILEKRQALESRDDIETSLLRLEYIFLEETDRILDEDDYYISKKLKFDDQQALYIQNYDVSILERIANLRTNRKLADIISIDPGNVDTLSKLLDLEYLDIQMSSYKNGTDYPTKRFFYTLGKRREFDRLDIDNMNFSDEEVLYYGLRINPRTYIDNMNVLSLNRKKK